MHETNIRGTLPTLIIIPYDEKSNCYYVKSYIKL